MASGSKRRDLRLRVSEKLYDELYEWSADELRSLNGLVEYLLTEAVKKRKKSFRPDDFDNEKSD